MTTTEGEKPPAAMGHDGSVGGRYERSFRRSGRLVGAFGAPFLEFRSGPTPEAAFEALAQPCLIASNHRSVFDALAGMYAIGKYGRSARTLSASWLWDDPRLGRLLDSVGAIPLPPGRGAIDAIDHAVDALRNGNHVLMTPEGRVVPREERPDGVGDGHKILSKIALAADVPVVPVALVGTDDFWPIGASRPVLRPLDRAIVGYGYGAPVHFDTANHRENVQAVMDAIATVVHQIEATIAPPAAAIV